MKFLTKLARFLFLTVFLIVLVGATLFWLPTGSWLALPAAQYFGKMLTPSLNVKDVDGSLAEGYTIKGVSLVSGDDTFLTLGRAAVSPDWRLIFTGTPWAKSIEVEAFSSDVAHLAVLGEHYSSNDDSEPEEKSSFEFEMQPLKVAIQDINILGDKQIGIPSLRLASLTLDNDGTMALRSHVDDVPLDLDGRLAFETLEILSSDIKLGTARASFKGKVMPPFDLQGDLIALPVETVLAFVPDIESAGIKASGRIDSRFALTGSDLDDLDADGVLSLGQGNIMGVPLNLRVPWNFAKQVFTLDDANLKTDAAAVNLSAMVDLSELANDSNALKIVANGKAQNVSLTEIGRMFAPEAGLTGTGGNVNFDIKLDSLNGLTDINNIDLSGILANFTAELPALEVITGHNATGKPEKITLKDLVANAKIASGDADGIISLGQSNVVGVPLSLSVPWNFVKQVFTLDNANLKTNAATVNLSAIVDLSKLNEDPNALKVIAKGNAQNISLTEIGRMFAPDAGLTGTGGNVNFDITLDGLDGLIKGLDNLEKLDLSGLNANFAANIPDIALAGKRIVKDLSATANVGPETTPRLDCTGRVFDAKLFARGMLDKNSSGKPEPSFTASLLNLDLATVAAAFPDLKAVKPQGKVSANINLANFNRDMAITGKITSDKISATVDNSPLALSNIAANFAYDINKGLATLQSLVANFGKAPITASGTVNVNKQALDLKASVRNFDPRTVPQLAGQFQGLCDVDTTVGGTFSDPRVNVQLKGHDNRAAGVPLGNLNLGVNYAKNRVSVPTTKINLPGGDVSLKADVDLGAKEPKLDVNVHSQSLDLAKITQFLASSTSTTRGAKSGGKASAPVTGTVKGDLDIRGPLSTAKISAKLQADGINVKTQEIDLEPAGLNVYHADFEAVGDMRQIDIKKLDVRFGKPTPSGRAPFSRIVGNGQLAVNQKDPMNSKLNLKMDVRSIYLNPILKYFTESLPVSGFLNASLALNGTPAQPALDLKILTPLTINQQMDVRDLGLKLKTPEKDHYTLTATGGLEDFTLTVDGDVRQVKDKGWAFRATTWPIDLRKLIATQAPDAAEMVNGTVVASIKGAIPNDFDIKKAAPIVVKVDSKKISALDDKINVTNITLPVEVSLKDNHIRLQDARATLSDGLIQPVLDVDLNKSHWTGKVSVRDLDFGKLSQPFMPMGELVGSADADVKLRGSFGGISMMFAEGSFKTGPGYIHKVDMIDKITPNKRVSFDTARGTFFWDGAELYINPGTQVLAGYEEPLYRNFGINGCAGLRGKGLNLLFEGRFDVKMLDQLLGAMKGVFQYAAGNLYTSVLREGASRILGVKSHDYQNVSFRLANSWEELQLRDLKIDKPIQDILPIDILNKAEEQQKETKQFRLSLKFPTGPGNPDAEEVSTSDQLKQQFIDNLFNIGM